MGALKCFFFEIQKKWAPPCKGSSTSFYEHVKESNDYLFIIYAEMYQLLAALGGLF